MINAAKWHRRFLRRAAHIAEDSKDPTTRVGCIIADNDNNECSTGWNGFPRGVAETPERLADRPLKLLLTVHAEANAVASAARRGVSLRNTTAYVTHPCCASCAGLLAQAGVTQVVVLPMDLRPGWESSLAAASIIYLEAGLAFSIFRDAA